jgi:hypothetical protein
VRIAQTSLLALLVLATLLAPPAAEAQVDDAARASFSRMAASLEGASQLSLQAFVAYDVVQPSGQKLQFHAANAVQLARPDRLHATIMREGTQREIWVRGNMLHLNDKSENTYGSISGPDSIDGMIDHLVETYGVSMPLADLLYSDIDDSLLDNALTGMLVGTTSIEGVPCEHLAFTAENVDWQIWVETSERAVPRKVVITYKKEAGAPQFTANLWDWNLGAELPAGLFEFSPPEGAQKIEMAPLSVPRPPQRPGRP